MKIDIKKHGAFLQALPVLEMIENHGYEAYFVGGSVRDALLGKKSHDVDIATSAFPNEIKDIFKKTFDIGIEHGTVMVLHQGETYEITTFRTESTYQDFRRPDSVTFVRSLEEDLQRRDFTMNALAMTTEGNIIDYFNGIADLENEVIKAVGDPFERFHEDALRMMRAVRFQGQFGFDIEENTKQAIQNNNYLLEKIAVERIHVEFMKMMLGNFRHEGLQSFIMTQLFSYCPELENQKVSLSRLNRSVSNVLTSEVQVWTLLSYFMDLEVKQVEPFLRKWKCSKDIMHKTSRALKGLNVREKRLLDNMELYELGAELVQEIEYMMLVLGKENDIELVERAYAKLPIKKRSELTVSGNDILHIVDEKPGKWLGELLEYLERKVVYGKIPNVKEELLVKTTEWLSEKQV